MRNCIEFETTGGLALFTDAILGTGGGCCSLPVPTYEALKGLCCSIYYAPSFEWVVDAVRVMNPIKTEPFSARMGISGRLCVHCCLSDVRYQVRAHFVAASESFSAPVVYGIAMRSLKKGGRRDTYLGKRMCSCAVRTCVFGEGSGYYDGKSQDFGLMYHGLDYSADSVTARLDYCRMTDGIIAFQRPSECAVTGIPTTRGICTG